jgi:tetratricopeptide (TPR) repeat protein
MDPLSKSIRQFQEEFRAIRDEGNARVVLLHCDARPTETVAKVLRAEEWQPDNKSPFLIFDTAYAEPVATFKTMSATVEQHYELMRKGLAKDGVNLPGWAVCLTGKETSLAAFITRLQAFAKNLVAPLKGLWICWLPGAVGNVRLWEQDVQTMLAADLPPNVRFLFADLAGGPLEKPIAALGEKGTTLAFEVDESGLIDYFKQLSAPAAPGAPKPHPGTMSGCARPDVEPPPRHFGPKEPSEDDLRAAIKAGKVPPMLLPSQGAKLRQLILEAASAAAENCGKDALQFQQEACTLCAEAGVKLEQALMTLVLACYHTQFKQIEKAAEQYRQAAVLAESAEAWPQVAQARTGYASLLLMSKQVEPAAQQYELAAEAARKGKTGMLRIETLRMAGACHLQLGKKVDATRCWQLAVETGKAATTGEIRNSTFSEVGASLVKLLREQRLHEQAQSVEGLIAQVSGKVEHETHEVRP